MIDILSVNSGRTCRVQDAKGEKMADTPNRNEQFPEAPDDGGTGYIPFPRYEGADGAKPEFRKPRNLKKKKILTGLLIAVLALAVIGAGVFVALRLFGGDKYDHTTEFYFASDLLTEEGGSFAQNGKISFRLFNYADSLRTSIYDIESFDISVKNAGEDITSACTVEASEKSIPANKKGDSSVTVSVPSGCYGVPLDVSVTSAPTKITLRGTFTVFPDWSYSLTSDENSIVATLVLSSGTPGVFTVKWDRDSVAADSNDPNVALAGKGDTCDVIFTEGGSYELRFFKNNITEAYSGNGDDLPVTVTFSDGGESK